MLARHVAPARLPAASEAPAPRRWLPWWGVFGLAVLVLVKLTGLGAWMSHRGVRRPLIVAVTGTLCAALVALGFVLRNTSQTPGGTRGTRK